MDYQLIRSQRKTLCVEIRPDGSLLVRAPARMPKREIDTFLLRKADWIEKHLPKAPPLPAFTPVEIAQFAQETANLLPEKVSHYAAALGVSYGRITVRCQKTRWGSCSSRGNLSFHCLLSQMPEAVFDYVVVHELCHRKHMNHSAAFWGEVAAVLPDYKASRDWLKTQGTALLSRVISS